MCYWLEDCLIQPFVPHRAIEPFHIGILRRFARLDKPQLDSLAFCPLAEIKMDRLYASILG
jgi:hypothetical protein